MNNHYYLELKDGVWVAEDHWGKEVARDVDKNTCRHKAEALGYMRWR